MVQQRFFLAGMLFLFLGIAFSFSMSFSLILTQMVYIPNSFVNSVVNKTFDANSEEICPIRYTAPQNQSDTINSIKDNSHRFHWSQELQGFILSSYYIGYVLTQIPGGILVHKYGAKRILLVGTLMCAIFEALIPLAVNYWQATGLIIVRILIGSFQGILLPCISAFIVAWLPIEEQGRTVSVIYMGINLGGFVSSYLSGITIYYTGRWDVVFYCIAISTAAISILFAFLCYEDPQSHPFISEKEKLFLKSKTAEFLTSERENLPPTPWKAIITNTPVIALLISSALYNWAFQVVNTDFPKYMNDVLHIPIENNAVYTALPRIAHTFASFFAGFLSDWMRVKRGVSITTIRKTFAALSSIVPSVFVIAASYAGCEEILAVSLLTISIAGQGFNTGGTILNGFDLGPNYIGPLSGMVAGVSTISSLMAPYIVGLLTPHAYMSEWRRVFWLTSILHMSKTIIFTIWGSGKVQPWNSPPMCTKNTC